MYVSDIRDDNLIEMAEQSPHYYLNTVFVGHTLAIYSLWGKL